MHVSAGNDVTGAENRDIIRSVEPTAKITRNNKGRFCPVLHFIYPE